MRKTISIDDALFLELQKEGLLEHFKNFSELVSVALRQSLQEAKKRAYKEQIRKMSEDPMVLEDIRKIEEDFQYSDFENAV